MSNTLTRLAGALALIAAIGGCQNQVSYPQPLPITAVSSWRYDATARSLRFVVQADLAGVSAERRVTLEALRGAPSTGEMPTVLLVAKAQAPEYSAWNSGVAPGAELAVTLADVAPGTYKIEAQGMSSWTLETAKGSGSAP